MNLGKILLGLFLSFVLVVVLLGGCVYRGYNRAISLDESVNASWAEVENQLQRRFDLVDNLVETVKGYAAQEKDIFLGVAEARKAYFQADSRSEKAQAYSGFESALSRLLVLRETYPQLKSNENFAKLQDSLEGTENRLAVARQRYNKAVRDLNTFTRRILGRLFASLAGVEPAEYFEVPEEAKTVPKVRFTDEEESG